MRRLPVLLLALSLLFGWAGPADAWAANFVTLDQAIQDLQADLSRPLEATAATALEPQMQQVEAQLEAREAALAARRGTLESQRDQLQRTAEHLEQSLRSLEDSQILSRVLLELRQSLPAVEASPELAAAIADLRLRQFDLARQLRDLSPRTGTAGTAPAGQVTPDRTLLALPEQLDRLIDDATTLLALEQEVVGLHQRLESRIDERMFWIPSNRPVDIQWLLALPEQLRQQLGEIRLGETLGELAAGLRSHPLVFLPLLLVIGLLLHRRRWLSARVAVLNEQAGTADGDGLWHTPVAILLTALQALPVSLALALCGLALEIDGRGQNASLGAALLAMAEVWLVFFTSYRILAPGGIAERHFHWPVQRVTFLRRHLRSLGLVMLGLAAVTRYAESLPGELSRDVLGTLIVLTGYTLAALLLFRVVQQRSGRDTPPGAGEVLVGALLAALPVALIVAVGLGYYYTALKLTGRLIDTLFLLIGWQLLQACLLRLLAVASTRLAHHRREQEANQQPASAATRPPAGEDQARAPGEEPGLDLDQVNQQSLRLLRWLMLGGLFLGLYLIWADLISLFAYLDNVSLWHYLAADGETQVSISLRDLLGALVLLAVAVALGRNLPGLLEVTVLSRLRLAQGSAYATTTLLSYVIFSIGFVLSLGTLGVSWDKLQWLVAALGVGLGFGLQEIFANFVSGLIILFERPIRIGDVVTLGNQSGVVKRIRIRATTISDFDRKDIVIPNKVFITGELTNWSLTDTVTRVIVRVGVAYGSDLELTRTLLLQAARENPRVIRDPEPLVYFLAFGTSTLDHELRVHVRELTDRNPAIDEINRRIDSLFREHGVEIAFNQIDVHLRSVPDRATLAAPGGNPAPDS